MPVAPLRERRFAALAGHLAALASETRLELLHALRTPTLLQEIRVGPSLSRLGENPERSLSRQAIAKHLENLQEVGLVRRTSGARGDAYVLNHERLFALVDELRGLSKLRPVSTEQIEGGETMDRAGSGEPELPSGPRLYVAYGRDDGTAYALGAGEGARWRVGRASECEVRLDYDPFLSQVHCEVERTPRTFQVRDCESRNGTFVNGRRLPRGSGCPLVPGDVLTVGRTSLVLQG